MEHKGETKEYKEVEARAAAAAAALEAKIGGGDEQSASQFLRNNKAGFTAANIKKTDVSDLEQRFGQLNKVQLPFFSCCRFVVGATPREKSHKWG